MRRPVRVRSGRTATKRRNESTMSSDRSGTLGNQSSPPNVDVKRGSRIRTFDTKADHRRPTGSRTTENLNQSSGWRISSTSVAFRPSSRRACPQTEASWTARDRDTSSFRDRAKASCSEPSEPGQSPKNGCAPSLRHGYVREPEIVEHEGLPQNMSGIPGPLCGAHAPGPATRRRYPLGLKVIRNFSRSRSISNSFVRARNVSTACSGPGIKSFRIRPMLESSTMR